MLDSCNFIKIKDKEAMRILGRIGGEHSARLEMPEIKASLTEGRQDWRELLQPGIRRAVGVGFVLAILIHVSGVNTVIASRSTNPRTVSRCM